MSSVEINLPEELTISQAHALHDEFEELLNKQNPEQLVVHASKVTRADTAGLQLMLTVVQITNERRIELKWDKPSEKFKETAYVLGLNNALGLH